MKPISKRAMEVLEVAHRREWGNICPCGRGGPAAQQALIDALIRRGLATDFRVPVITQAGRDLVMAQANLNDPDEYRIEELIAREEHFDGLDEYQREALEDFNREMASDLAAESRRYR